MSRDDLRQRCAVVTWFYPDQPGFLDFSYRLNALAERFSLTIYSRDALTQEELTVEDASYVILRTAGTSTWELFLYQCRVVSRIRRERPDLVVFLGSHTAAAALQLRKFPRVVYWNEHPTHYFGVPRFNLLKRWLLSYLMRRTFRGAIDVERVLPIGEAHRDDLLERGAEPSRVRLQYMGVSSGFSRLEPRGPGRAPGAAVRVIYTGTVQKERGRDIMLEGLARALAEGADVSLTIVGASEEQRVFCEQLAARLGIEHKVRVYGRVPGKQIPSFLMDADVGVCIWEDRIYWRFNPPTKLFEYLVAGLPVLASRIRTHEEYVHSWENGVIFDYSSDAFGRCLVEVWQRRDEIEGLAVGALRSSQRYLWTTIRPKFLEAVEEAVAVRGGVRGLQRGAAKVCVND